MQGLELVTALATAAADAAAVPANAAASPTHLLASPVGVQRLGLVTTSAEETTLVRPGWSCCCCRHLAPPPSRHAATARPPPSINSLSIGGPTRCSGRPRVASASRAPTPRSLRPPSLPPGGFNLCWSISGRQLLAEAFREANSAELQGTSPTMTIDGDGDGDDHGDGDVRWR